MYAQKFEILETLGYFFFTEDGIIVNKRKFMECEFSDSSIWGLVK